jgi:hypothetical protein
MRCLLVLLFGLIVTSSVYAEPEFLYYTTAECGNDYFTRCVIEPQETGAKFSIFHGFMQSPLVETGEMTDAEWADFQTTVIAQAKNVSPSTTPTFNVDHFQAPALQRTGPCPNAMRQAFAKTKPGRSFSKWVKSN